MKRRRAGTVRPADRIPVVAFLLLLAFGGLWLLSYGRADLIAFFTPAGKLQGAASHNGRLLLFFSNLPFRPQRGLTFDYDNTSAGVFGDVRQQLVEQTPGLRGGLGFEYAHSRPDPFGMAGKSFTFFSFPHWVMMLIMLLPSVVRLRRLRRSNRRARQGRCRRCGYDLRETTGRCPECGEERGPAKVATAAA
jgi:hypothetical protein